MKYVIVITITVFTFIGVKAQELWSFQNLINVGTVSPEAASLGRFGAIPVSHFTGIPSITVPVYEINAGRLKLPISLDYHAGGVRVDELSSSVGTGWALNGISIITRNMIGLPDTPGSTDHNYISSPDAQDVTSSPGSYDTFIMEVWNKASDTEPDIFQYNVNGLSGKFIFRNDGSIMQIPLTNNKITYASGNFTITDPQGNIYMFEEKRKSYSNDVHEPTYVSTWCLTKAVDANSADTITFSYETTIYSTYSDFTNTTSNWGASMSTSVCSGGSGESAVCSGASGDLQYAFETMTYEGYNPKEIKWRGGKITFTNVNDRTDDTGTALRLDRIDVYAKLNGGYSLVQKTKLYQSYFFSNPGGTATEKNYRLKLDSVGNLDPTTDARVQVYKMAYNSTAIAPRESYAQDRWGFTNGKYDNTGQMPKQTILYVGAYYDFGNADRDTDATKIVAGTLSSIEYPTRGKTVLEMEPHKYHTNLPVTQLNNLLSSLCCGNNSFSQQTFTVNSNSNNFRYKVFISKFNYSDVTDRPRIKLFDQTAGGTLIVQQSNSSSDVSQNYVTGTLALDLVQGHTYMIEINIFTTNPNVSASMDLWWDETIPGASDIELAGGLRVKSITNYDAAGDFINKEVYQYGDDGTGIMITPQYYQNINYENTTHRIGYAPCGAQYCQAETAGGNCSSLHPYMTTYHANSVYPVSQFSGTPVVYKKVTQFSVDRNGNDNGKTVYTFNVVNDSAEPVPHINTVSTSDLGIALVSNVWQNGMLLKKEVYKTTPSGYQLMDQAINQYQPSLLTTQEVLRPKHKYTQLGDCLVTTYQDFLLPVVPINSGSMLLQSTTTTTAWDDSGTPLVSVQNFTYGSSAPLPSSIANTSSTGETLTENFTYPIDLAAPGNVYKKMDDRNMKAIVVRDQKLLGANQVSLVNINYYDWFGNSTLLMPISVSEQVGSNQEEVKIQYNEFDSYGNILRQQKANDYLHSYLWDYTSKYPTAEVLNADNTSIAYTSFEAEGAGNWTISSSNRDATQAITGSRSYVIGSNTVSKLSGLTSTRTYIVSYWKKGGAAGSFTVSGTTQTVTGETINSWIYYEHTITGVSTVSITGSGNIDELRLYPKDAQLTTYTYKPLIGMTSSTDAKNVITYYEYDPFGRLKWIKDAKGNIIKAFEYHYRSK